MDSQGIGYDINSVMHYGPDYFAKQGTYTILKKVPGKENISMKEKIIIHAASRDSTVSSLPEDSTALSRVAA